MNDPDIRVHASPWEQPYSVEELRRVARVIAYYGQTRKFQTGTLLRGLADIFVVLEGACEAFLLDGQVEFAVAQRYVRHDFFMSMDATAERDRFPDAREPDRQWRTVEATTCSVLDGRALQRLFDENRAASTVLCADINRQWTLHNIRRLQELVISRLQESRIRVLLQYARFGDDGSIAVPVLIDKSIAPCAGPGGRMPVFYISARDAPIDQKSFLLKHRMLVHDVFAFVRDMWAAGHMRLTDRELVFSDALCRWLRRKGMNDVRP